MQWAGFDAPDDDIKAMIKLAGCAAGGDEEVVTYDGLLKILALDNSHVA
jgi:calmodulin